MSFKLIVLAFIMFFLAIIPGQGVQASTLLAEIRTLYDEGNANEALSLIQSQGDSLDPDQRILLETTLLLTLNRQKDAEILIEHYLASNGLIGDYVLFQLMEYHLGNEDYREAERVFSRIQQEFTDTVLIYRGALKLSRTYREEEDAEKAGAYLNLALSTASDSEEELEANLFLFEYLQEENRTKEALFLLMRLYDTYDGLSYTRTRQLLQPLNDLLEKDEFPPSERLSAASFLSRLGYRGNARQFAESISPSSLSEQERRERGTLLIQIAVNTDRLEEVSEILAQTPELSQTDTSFFYRGVVHQRLGRYEEAAELFSSLLDRFPNTEYLFNTFRNLAFCYRAVGETSQYDHVMEKMIAAFPGRGDVRWDYFWNLYQRGNVQKGQAVLEGLTSLSDEYNRANFWLYLTDTSHNNDKYLEKILYESPSVDYYYVRAWQEAQTQGWELSRPPSILFRSENFDHSLPSETLEAHSLWVRYELLRQTGFLDFALGELKALRRRNPEKQDLLFELSDLHYELGNLRQSILQALYLRSALGGDSPPYRNVQERIYPEYYLDMIENIGQKEDIHVDPYLVLSVLRAESFFDAEAVSVAGAIGLMQIMPATGAWMAERVDHPVLTERSWETSRLFEPHVNLVLGVEYLAYLMDMYERKKCPAICAYNAGPGRVNSWRESLPDDPDKFVESIPFQETRNYLKGVVENYFHYSWLYRKDFTLSPCTF